MKKKVKCVLVLLCCCAFCSAQQVVSSGGYAVKSDITVNWILGGSLSNILPINPDDLNQMLHEKLMESEISVKIYPLPATDLINIEIIPVDTGRINLELYNNSGIKVLNKISTFQPFLQVDVSALPSGIYYLKIFQPSSVGQLFKVKKVIKH